MKGTRLGTGYSERQHDSAKNILERVEERQKLSQMKRVGRSSHTERDAVEGIHVATGEKKNSEDLFYDLKNRAARKGASFEGKEKFACGHVKVSRGLITRFRPAGVPRIGSPEVPAHGDPHPL